MLKFVCSLILLATIAHAWSHSEYGTSFIDYVQKFDKQYTTDEYELRFKNFKASSERIKKKNKESQGRVKWAINKFSDMSPDEFRQKILMTKKITPKKSKGEILSPKSNDLPSTFDWRPQGAVTAVKNQEQCGSCWAFSVVENVESMWILAGKGKNSTVDLSPQQVVDCDQVDLGCDGGDPPYAYNYIISAGGLESEDDYPYTAEDGDCQFNKSEVAAKISKWKYATSSYDEQTLQQNLVSWGPLSICVDAANWQDYSSGVLGPWECAWVLELDHCVELVGYDQTAQYPYWTVRNSWGTDWGQAGYILLEMGHNTCGLTEEATTAVI